MGFINLSRFITAISGVTISSIANGYANPSVLEMPPGGMLLTMSFFISSFLMFDVREKGYLSTSLFISIALLYNFQWFNDFFVLEPESVAYNDKIIGGIFILIAAANLIASIFLIQQQNFKSEKRTEQLISGMNIQNNELKGKENALNESIIEIKKAQEEDVKRKWASDGLAKFAEILRSEDNLSPLSEKIITNLVKFMRANQGTIFIANETEQNETYLELMACYAYDRKKYLEKRIEIGEGLVGQCYLERDVILLTNIPKDYVHITSGLGEATPTCLLIVPLIVNEKINGILELASFKKFESYEVDFIKKVAQNISSVIDGAKVNELTKSLLTQSQEQSEMMRAQEEEMRQNMEELVATQEEMQRKQLESETKSEMTDVIIENIPFPIFIKDEKGIYTLVNKAQEQLLGSSKEQIIGFDDSKFIQNIAELEAIRKSDAKIVDEKIILHFPEQALHMPNGTYKVLKTTKTPFVNKASGMVNILGVSADHTDAKLTEQDLKKKIVALEKLVNV